MDSTNPTFSQSGCSAIPSKVIRWSNDIVMVFDGQGKQMPEHQGRYLDVIDKLRQLDLSGCEFYNGVWQQEVTPISAEEFFTSET